MRAIFIAIFMLVCVPAYAASIDIGQAFSESLQPYINAVVTALITAMVGWVLALAAKYFNVQVEADHREALTLFLQRKASGLVADGAVKLKGIRIEVDNAALAAAANTALAAIPQAMSWFNLTPDKVAQMIVDLIPKQPAIAEAQAVALDVKNPETPSTEKKSG